MVEQIEIVKQLQIPEASFSLRSDGIVEVNFNEGTIIDVALQKILVDNYWELCSNQKRCFIFKAFDNITVTKEGRDNAIVIEDTTPVKASAIVTSSLAYKLIAQFYIKVNKPKNPFNIFRNEEEAIKWLKQYI